MEKNILLVHLQEKNIFDRYCPLFYPREKKRTDTRFIFYQLYYSKQFHSVFLL